MKKLSKISLFLLPLIALFFLAACGNSADKKTEESSSSSSSVSSSSKAKTSSSSTSEESVSTVYLGIGLIECELKDWLRYSVPVVWAFTVALLIFAVITGCVVI